VLQCVPVRVPYEQSLVSAGMIPRGKELSTPPSALYDRRIEGGKNNTFLCGCHYRIGKLPFERFSMLFPSIVVVQRLPEDPEFLCVLWPSGYQMTPIATIISPARVEAIYDLVCFLPATLPPNTRPKYPYRMDFVYSITTAPEPKL